MDIPEFKSMIKAIVLSIIGCRSTKKNTFGPCLVIVHGLMSATYLLRQNGEFTNRNEFCSVTMVRYFRLYVKDVH